MRSRNDEKGRSLNFFGIVIIEMPANLIPKIFQISKKKKNEKLFLSHTTILLDLTDPSIYLCRIADW